MSKEQNQASYCKCGMIVAFMEYHWPHCPMNPTVHKGAVVRPGDKVG